MFNSYVKLPEGTHHNPQLLTNDHHLGAARAHGAGLAGHALVFRCNHVAGLQREPPLIQGSYTNIHLLKGW